MLRLLSLVGCCFLPASTLYLPSTLKSLHQPTRHNPSPSRRQAPNALAGFASPKPAKKAEPSRKKRAGKAKTATKPASALSPRTQWNKYNELEKAGATAPVYARDSATDADEWQKVGTVAAANVGELAAAAQYQKRLILEHACRMYPRLALAQKTLEGGLEVSDDSIEPLGKGVVEDPPASGFVGEPDPGNFYSRGNQVDAGLGEPKGARMDSKGRF